MSNATTQAYREQNVPLMNLFEQLSLCEGSDNRSSTSRSRCTSAKSAKSAKSNIDRALFTFKPKINHKSKLLAENSDLVLNFYERQNIHTQKQLEIVS